MFGQWRILFLFIFVSGLFHLATLPTLAQAQTPWQAADTIRDSLFQAQADLLAAASTDDPQAAHDAAAKQVAAAATAYTTDLQPALAVYAPEQATTIDMLLDEAQQAAATGGGTQLAVLRGLIWTQILQGSFLATQRTLAEGDLAAARSWLQIREFRESTKISTVDNLSAQAITQLQAGSLDPAEAMAIVTDDLRDTYFFRLREALNELEAAAERDYTTRAAEWAGLAAGYFVILREDIVSKQGESTADEIDTALVALTEQAIASDWVAIDATLATARDLVRGYQPVALDEATIADRGTLLYTFTDLIYIEYKDGVRNGEITIPIEYYEAQTFHEQAVAIYQELRPTLETRDPAATARLNEIFSEIDVIMEGLGDTAQVERLVAEALGLIETTLAVEPAAGGDGASFTVITTLLDGVIAAAEEGRYDEAERTRLEAYAVFEGGPEQRLANRMPVLSRELEGLFWEGIAGEPGLAVLIRQEAAPEQIAAVVAQITPRLAEADTVLASGLTGIFAALNSLAIIVREGLEAVLIIGAIVGYLRTTGEPKRYSTWVYGGVIAAILLSLLTWWAATTIITITVANRELIEGVTSLIAVAVLFYVTNWLFHKVYVLDWLTFVKQNVGHAISTGSAFGLAALGFTVVYREGFETVLFYQALLFDADPLWVLIGFGVGLVIILGVAYAILHLGQRLPLKPFFTTTGVLLLLLAFSFTGSGVRELQEAGVVGVTLLPIIPENLLLMEVLGIFPTVETTLAQMLFGLALAATFALSLWRGRLTQQKVPADTRSS